MRGFTDKCLILLPYVDYMTESQIALMKKTLTALSNVLPGRWDMEPCIFDFNDLSTIVRIPDNFQLVQTVQDKDRVMIVDKAIWFTVNECKYKYPEIYARAENKIAFKRGLDDNDRWAAAEERQKESALAIIHEEFKVIIDLQTPKGVFYSFAKKPHTGIYMKMNMKNGVLSTCTLNNESKNPSRLLNYPDSTDPLYLWRSPND